MLAVLSIDWRSLPWREPERWPPSWQRALPALSFAFTLLLSAAGLWWPGVQEWRSLHRETRNLQEQTQQALQRSQILQQQQARRSNLQARHERALQDLGDDDALRVMQRLRERAEQNDLLEERYEPLPDSRLDCCEVQSSRWVLRGHYADLRDWLEAIAQEPMLLRADQLQWQRAEDTATADEAPLQLQLLVHHYRRPEVRP